jgi:hypothetical protein
MVLNRVLKWCLIRQYNTFCEEVQQRQGLLADGLMADASAVQACKTSTWRPAASYTVSVSDCPIVSLLCWQCTSKESCDCVRAVEVVELATPVGWEFLQPAAT